MDYLHTEDYYRELNNGNGSYSFTNANAFALAYSWSLDNNKTVIRSRIRHYVWPLWSSRLELAVYVEQQPHAAVHAAAWLPASRSAAACLPKYPDNDYRAKSLGRSQHRVCLA